LPGDTASSLLKRADQALYEAKAAGRRDPAIRVDAR
jgi:PleD family two-component response regulator